MKLRTQLLVINLLSLGLLISALMLATFWKMYLTLSQTWLLTGIALGAGLLSSIAFSLMTLTISRSINRLITFSDSVANLSFEANVSVDSGPTEVRHLAQSLQTMNKRLSDSFSQLEIMERTRRELVANISHDLRTPLASIQSYVEALEDGVVEEKSEQDRYLRTIHNESLRMGRLIDDLFHLSKLEAGQESLDAVPTHLDQVLAEVLDSHLLLLREKHLEVSVDVPEDLPTLWLSPEKIHRVLANLLQNAIRYSPAASILELRVTRLEDTHSIEVSLADHGPGLQSDHKSQLFERFYRVDPSRSRNTGGAGLGLAIARWLTQLHGGDIGVRDRADGDRGAVFWFTLPIAGSNGKL